MEKVFVMIKGLVRKLSEQPDRFLGSLRYEILIKEEAQLGNLSKIKQKARRFNSKGVRQIVPNE
jgi:hypothetical protein